MKTTKLFFALLIISQATMAIGNFSLVEINPLHGTQEFFFSDSAKTFYGAGQLNNLTEFNNKLYFGAQSSPDNTELWMSDGTTGGTLLVKEINATGSADIGNIAVAGGKLFFMATENGTDYDLWMSDGSDNGTTKIAELNQSWNGALSPQNISVMGSRLLFCTQDQLIITDGTTAGTDSLHAITTYAQGFGYCELNNKAYFILPNGNGTQELWRTDGTVAGTEMVIDLTASSSNIISIDAMLSFNHKLFLVASASGHGPDLFAFNGNATDTLERNIIATGGSSYPTNVRFYNNAIYFIASTMTSANVFRIAEGSSTAVELLPGATYSWLSNLGFANNKAYFFADGQKEIQILDLNTLARTTLVLDGLFAPNFLGTDQPGTIGANGKIFFQAVDSASNKQVFVESDGTLQGTQVVMPAGANTEHPFNFISGCGTLDVFDFKIWGNKVIVPANFTDAGRELWIYEPEATTGIIQTQNENTFSLFPNPAKGDVTVKTNSNGYCDQEIAITNVSGQVVLKTVFQNESTTIKLSLLATGNYCATLSENGKVIGTKKLVLVK
ncbi:MAG: T9SS type A sorting domain-containing protein [Bacteroidetes bacterium]|nr:T9SS type A sorting domain-containing protein [Bacteroidota bacterium]